jgi:hypothetical protein
VTKTYPEPPDRTIVGFGSPVIRVYVRVDEWRIDVSPEARWWEASDDSTEDPITWAKVTDGRHYGEPYILVPAPMEATE